MSRRFIPAIVIIALAVSVTLKGMRYLNSAPIGGDASIGADIAHFIKPYGWVAAGQSENPGHEVFQTFSFAKKSCANQIHVAVLGNNTELENFARLSMGGDVGFLQNNEFVKKQSAIGLQLAQARFSLAALFGSIKARNIPVLAISPTPPVAESACAPPAIKFWRNFAPRRPG